MKHHTHLSINTLITVLTLLLLAILVIRQDNLIYVINKSLLNQLVMQESISEAKRISYNAAYEIKQMIPTPTMGTLIIHIDNVK
jgi:hypothetical protein